MNNDDDLNKSKQYEKGRGSTNLYMFIKYNDENGDEKIYETRF